MGKIVVRQWSLIWIIIQLIIILSTICIEVGSVEDHDIANNDHKDDWSGSKDSSQDDDDSDSDEDDLEDDKDKTNTVIIAAVPIALGIIAIALVCVFMLCRRKTDRQSNKWAPRWLQSVSNSRSDGNQVVQEHPYEVMTYVVTHPTLQECATPSAPPEDCSLPPSYEEVMREQRKTDTLSRFAN